MPDSDPAREPTHADEVDPIVAEAEAAAAAEAADIGGRSSRDDEEDGPQQAVAEGGGGEAEGFELAEQELIDHASHGDQHAARRALKDAPDEAEDRRAASGGEADHERSSERAEDS